MNPHSWHMANTPAYRNSLALRRIYGSLIGSWRIDYQDRERILALLFLLYKVIL